MWHTLFSVQMIVLSCGSVNELVTENDFSGSYSPQGTTVEGASIRFTPSRFKAKMLALTLMSVGLIVVFFHVSAEKPHIYHPIHRRLCVRRFAVWSFHRYFLYAVENLIVETCSTDYSKFSLHAHYFKC